MTDKPSTPLLDYWRNEGQPHSNYDKDKAITEHLTVCDWYDARIAELERTLVGMKNRLVAEVTGVTADLKQRTEAYESSLKISREQYRLGLEDRTRLRTEVADLNGALDAAIAAASEWEAKARTPRTVPPSYKGVTYGASKEHPWRIEQANDGARGSYVTVASLIAYNDSKLNDDDHAPILALRDATPRDVGETVKSIRNVGAVVQRICDAIRDEEIGPSTGADKILSLFTGDAS